MNRMNDKDKWEILWTLSAQVGSLPGGIIETRASWNPSHSELRNYRENDKYPIIDIKNIKEKKHVLEIIDNRTIEPSEYDVKIIYMTSGINVTGWGAVPIKKLIGYNVIDGYIIVLFPNDSRNFWDSSLYLITRTELIDDFGADNDNRLHLKSDDPKLEQYKLPPLDGNENMEIKKKLLDICDRLNKEPKLSKPSYKTDINAYYVDNLVKEIAQNIMK